MSPQPCEIIEIATVMHKAITNVKYDGFQNCNF